MKKRRQAPSVPDPDLELAQQAARLCDEKRGEDIQILDLRRVCNYADFFVIATASSPMRLKGIAAAVRKELRSAAARSRAGEESDRWALIDCGSVVVHIFDREARDFYRLEELWGDAPKIPFTPAAPVTAGN